MSQQQDRHVRAPGWTPRTAYVLGLLTLIYAFNSVDRNLFGLLVPQIQHDLQISDATVGLLSGFTFALFYATAALPIASFADHSNRRNVIAIGLAFWSLMTGLHAFVRNVWQLSIARFLLGAGEASSVAPSNSIIADLFTEDQRPLALGLLSMATSLGLLLAFPVLGRVAQVYGWRAAFVAAGIPGIVVASILYLTVREPARIADVRGSGDADDAGLWHTICWLLKSRAYVFCVLAGTLTSMDLAITQAWLPTFLTRVHGMDTAALGALIGFLRGPGGIVGGLMGGWLTSYLGGRHPSWLYRVPAIGMVLIAPAQLLLLFGPPALWRAGIALDSVLVVSTMGPLFALLVSVAEPRMRSVAVALFLLISNLCGQSVGPFAVGMLSQWLTPALGTDAIRYSMLLAAVGAVCASAFCLASGAESKSRAGSQRLD